MPVSEVHIRAAGGRPGYHGRAGAPRPARCRAVPPAGPHQPVVATPGHVGARPAVRWSALVGAFAVLLATCAVWVQGGGGRAGSDPLTAPGTGRTVPAAAHVWVVQPGDTLWAIARRLDPNGDVRPLVDALSREVHGRPLQVGQQIVLP